MEHQTSRGSIMDLQISLKKNLLVTFTHGASPTFSTWFSVMLLRLIMHHISIWISSKGWSVLSGIIFANGHVERADEPRLGQDIRSRLNLIGATRWWSKHQCL